MADIGSNAWLSNFINQLQIGHNTKSTAVQMVQQSMADRASSQSTGPPGTISSNPGLISEQLDPPDYSSDPGFWSRAIDIVERPLYATANVANEIVNSIKNQSADDPFDPFAALGRGFTGKDKTTWGSVVSNALPDNMDPDTKQVLSGALGFLGDIALDPINLTPMVAVKGVKALKGATKAGKTAGRLDIAKAVAAEQRAGKESNIAAMLKEITAGKNATAPGIGGSTSITNKMIKDAPTPEGVDIGPTVSPEVKWAPDQTWPSNASPEVNWPAAEIRPAAAEPGAFTKAPDAPDVWGEGSTVAPVKSLNEEAKVAKAQQEIDVTKQAKIDTSTAGIDDLITKATNGRKIEADGYRTEAPAAGTEESMLTSDLIAKSHALMGTITQGKRTADLMKEAIADTKQSGLKGTQASEVQKSQVLRRMGELENEEIVRGVEHTVASAKGAPQWNLRMSQLIDMMPESLATRVLPNYPTTVTPSAITGMAAKALDLASTGRVFSREEFVDALMKTGKEHKIQPPLNSVMNRTIKNYDESLKRVADTFWFKQDDLMRLSNQNALLFETSVQRAGKEIADTVQEQIVKDMDLGEGGTTTDSIKDLADVHKIPSNIKDPKTRIAASVNIAENIAKITNAGDVTAAKAARSIAKMGANPNVSTRELIMRAKNIRIKAAKEQMKEADNMLMAADPEMADLLIKVKKGEPVDNGMQISAQIENIADRKISPIRSMSHTAFHDAGEMGQFWKHRQSGYLARLKEFEKDIKATMSEFAKPEINAAFKAHKLGIAPTEEGTLAAYNAMHKYVDSFFDVTGKDPMLGSLFRNGYTLDTINKAMKEQHLPHEFNALDTLKSRHADLSAKARNMLLTDKTAPAARTLQADSWRTFDVEDPIEFMMKMRAVEQNLALRSSVADHAGALYGVKHVPANKMIAGNKYGKLPAFGDEADTIVYQHLNKELYYPQDAIDNLTNLERVFKQSTSFKGKKGALGWFINNALDPFLGLWKPLVTILRPGHAVRNAIGDMFLNVLAGVWSPSHYKDALGIMASVGQLPKPIMEMMKANGWKISPNKTFKITLKGGKPVKYTNEEMFAMAQEDGILPSFVQSEDILKARAGEAKGIEKVSDRILATRWMQGTAGANEKLSWFFRLTQYKKLMTEAAHSKKFRTLDEARTSAAAETTKYHPDTTGLDPLSKKYMRRIFPFYSWIRQVMPVILETLVTHPARITVVNKGIYNAGMAMGNDPKSLSDPWPGESVIPDFLRDQMGYMGGKFAFNLGTPTESAADILNGNVPRNLLSMLNPIIKAPVDLATGTNMSTGAPIMDKGEYIDSQLPGIGTFASISGISPTGSATSLLQGKGIDYQRSVQKGEKQLFNNTSLYNFFTGLSMQNINKPTYSNIASNTIRRSGIS